MKQKVKKILISLIVLMILINNFSVLASSATEIESESLTCLGHADEHLKYYRDDTDSYRYIECTVIGYYDNSTLYPAYCMNKGANGITEDYTYSVNINEIINRDDVWRVIKNGYPYKTASEMGLNSDFDAYTVTKMAVYCILGESDINNFLAENDDTEAVNMITYLKKLVDIGQNGTETRNSVNIELSKEGEFTENENYYFQKYNIESSIEMNDFEVSSLENFPEGSYTNKLNNTSFELYIPKEQLNSKISGNIEIKAKCKTYPIFYGKTSIEGTQNYALTYSEFGDVISKVYTEIETNNSKIKVHKIDKDSQNSLENVSIGLYKDGNLLESKTTNSNGEVDFENLYQGTYIIKELETLEEFNLSDEEIPVDLKINEEKNIQLENEKIKGRLKILKVDKDDNNIKLEGVKFNIYDEKHNLIENLVTDQNGIAYSNFLPSVNRVYTVTETEPLSDYENNKEYTFVKLSDNKDCELIIENEKIKEEKVEEKEEIIEAVSIEEAPIKEAPRILPRTGY